MKLLVLAQVPPPLHGQSAMVQAMLESLPKEGFVVRHVNLRLSRTSAEIGRWHPAKAGRLGMAVARAIIVRVRHRCDTLYYVPAPAKRGALYRDWLVMLMMRPLFRRLVLHWHAPGLGEWLRVSASPLERWVTRRMLGRADLAIVLSDRLRGDAEQLVPERIVVVPNGVPDPGPGAPVPRSAPCRVLFLGLCSDAKGVFRAAEAVLTLNGAAGRSAQNPAFVLTAGGPFPDPATARRFAALAERHPTELQHVGLVTGDVKDRLFAATRIVCLPTRYEAEGLPLVLLEALAHDRPVVATAWRGIPDVVTPEVGRLVPLHNPAALMDALRTLDERPLPPGSCRQRYLDHFTLQRHRVLLVAAMQQLAKANGSSHCAGAGAATTEEGDRADAPWIAEHAHQGYHSTLWAQVVRMGCKLISVVTLARWVTPEEHGRFAMAASLTLVLVLFRDLGLGAAALQAPVLSHAQKTALAWTHAALGAGLAALTAVLAPAVARFYGEPQVQRLLLAMSTGLLLIGLNAWPRVLLLRDLRFRVLNRLETVGAAVGTFAMISAGAAGAGAFAFVIFLLVSEAVILIEAWRACGWRPRGPPQWATLRPLLDKGLDLAGYQLLVHLLHQIDAVLMGRWFGAGPTGHYTRPAQVLFLAHTHLAAPFAQVLLATLSRVPPESAEFTRQLRNGANLVAHLTLPVASLCLALPTEIIRLVLGPDWTEAAPLLRWLAVGGIASSLTVTLPAVALAIQRTRRLAVMTTVTLLLVVMGVAVGQRHGPSGLAAGAALALVLSVAPRWWWMLRETRVRFADMMKAWHGPLVLNLALGTAAWAAARAFVESGPLTRFAAGAVGGFAAVAALLGVRAHLRREVGVLARQLWTGRGS